MDVDTRVLRYFVAVAEHLSFTQAARALFVSQPSLSRQIRQLEDRLGTELFVRTKTEVRLTRTGEVLLAAARRQLVEWEQATRIVRTTAAADANLLRVGLVAGAGSHLVRLARPIFQLRHPQATLEPKRFEPGAEGAALRQGTLDVALLWLPPLPPPTLHTAVVAAEPRLVALPTTHRLATRPSLTLADLRDEPALWTRQAPTAWADQWPTQSPPEPDAFEDLLARAAATAAVCVAPASIATTNHHPELTWRAVADLTPLQLAVTWPTSTANPLVPPFVHALRSLGIS